MLVRIEWSERRTEGPKERGKPKEFAGDALQQMRGATLGGQRLPKKGAEAGEFGRIKPDAKVRKIQLPTNPDDLCS